MTFENYQAKLTAQQTGAKAATVVLPRFQHIPFGVMRKIRKANSEEQMFELFELLHETGKISDTDMAVIDSLGIETIGELVEGWQKDAETSLPES
ncbi:hypothetical protein [Gordonia sp. DT101]|uniref:hypothetical protein n=1 Tax=Gordonia sp. DT101 TaxID=3416545 RepID=UPI003CE92F3B